MDFYKERCKGLTICVYYRSKCHSLKDSLDTKAFFYNTLVVFRTLAEISLRLVIASTKSTSLLCAMYTPCSLFSVVKLSWFLFFILCPAPITPVPLVSPSSCAVSGPCFGGPFGRCARISSRV